MPASNGFSTAPSTRVARDRDHPAKLEFLTIKSAGHVAFVSLAEIDWVEAADYYAALHVGAENSLVGTKHV